MELQRGAISLLKRPHEAMQLQEEATAGRAWALKRCSASFLILRVWSQKAVRALQPCAWQLISHILLRSWHQGIAGHAFVVR